jgi:hypothetical protein
MTPTDVRVTLPPDGANDYEWWYDATKAWVKAAGDAGLVVDEEYMESSYVKTLCLRVGDTWYDIQTSATEVYVIKIDEPSGIRRRNELTRIITKGTEQ